MSIIRTEFVRDWFLFLTGSCDHSLEAGQVVHLHLGGVVGSRIVLTVVGHEVSKVSIAEQISKVNNEGWWSNVEHVTLFGLCY